MSLGKVYVAVPKVYAFISKKHTKKVGGAEIQMLYIGKELRKRGFDVHYISSDYGQKKLEEYEGLFFHNVFSYGGNQIVSLWKILSFIFRRVDGVLIFQSASFATAITILLSRFLLRKNVLYMVASDKEVSPALMKRDRSRITAFLMNWVMNNAGFITAQTQFQHDLLPNKQIDSCIIPNLLPPLNLPNVDKTRVCWVGKSLKMKNAELFIELAARNPDLHFDFVLAQHNPNCTYWEELREKAAQVKNIVFRGQLEHQQVLEIYAPAWLYVMTSDYEGFSNSMMEALGAGCAVLSYNVNPDDILHRFEMGRCANGDKEMFFQLFTEMKNNLEQRSEMKINAKEYIKQHHTPEAIPEAFWRGVEKLSR